MEQLLTKITMTCGVVFIALIGLGLLISSGRAFREAFEDWYAEDVAKGIFCLLLGVPALCIAILGFMEIW